MIPTAHREFLESHRLAVVAVQGDTRLSLTPVYYVVDGDHLLVSTQATRLKAREVAAIPMWSCASSARSSRSRT